MKKPRNEQGLKKMMRDFGAETEAQDGKSWGYGCFDFRASRGALAYLPDDGISRVVPADTGLTSNSGLGISSEARADITTGRLWGRPRIADKRVMPETHLPGSMNTEHAGLSMDVRKYGKLRKDMETPQVEE